MGRRINKKRLGILLAILFVFLMFIFYTGGRNAFNYNNKVVKQEKYIKSTESTEKKAKKESITISFAGDVTMGNYKGSSYYSSFDHEFEKQNQNYSYFFQNVKDVFEQDDLTVVNLEGPLTTSNNAQVKRFAFKGDPTYVNILKEGNIEAVTLANNHSKDYLEEGLNDTEFILKENGIEYFGSNKQAIIDIKGVKVGLLGYNGWLENYNDKYLNNMKNEIEVMKKESDLILAYFHWGTERMYYPDKVQIDFAHFAIDSGVDGVLGSHPHVIQGIEKYKEKYIAYSLSNFCFGGNKNPKDKDTFIYQQTFNFEDEKLVSINKPNLIPCSISSKSNINNYQPTPSEGEEKNRILNKIIDISESLNK